VSKVI